MGTRRAEETPDRWVTIPAADLAILLALVDAVATRGADELAEAAAEPRRVEVRA